MWVQECAKESEAKVLRGEQRAYQLRHSQANPSTTAELYVQTRGLTPMVLRQMSLSRTDPQILVDAFVDTK